MPTTFVSRSLGELLRACVMALQAWYAAPGGTVVAAAGALLSTAVTGRLIYSGTVVLCRASRERQRHRAALALIGVPHRETGTLLVQHGRPAAYCVPGRPHQVVLTTATLKTLDGAQLAGVLAHERAHLRGRHHLLVAGFAAAETAFPLPALRTATGEVARLVEMLADDHAGHSADRLDLAEALLALAGSPVPHATLGAGTAAATRVRRLLAPPKPLGSARAAAAATLAALVIALPATVASQPALAAQVLPYCFTDHAPTAPSTTAAADTYLCDDVATATGHPATPARSTPCPQ